MALVSAEEEALIASMIAVRDGDDAAFRSLVDTLSGRLQRFFAQRGAPAIEIEELVQETLIRVYRKRTSYRPGRSVTAWTFAIGRNLMIDRYRRQRPHVSLEAVAEPVAPPAPDSAAVADIWALARRVLKPRDFEAVWLRYGANLTTPEVAQTLGLSGVHARVLLHRARKRLALELRKEWLT